MSGDKSNDIFFLIIGVSLSVFGVFSIVRQEFNSVRFGHINLGQYHYLIGFAFLVIGLWIIYSVWTKK